MEGLLQLLLLVLVFVLSDLFGDYCSLGWVS